MGKEKGVTFDYADYYANAQADQTNLNQIGADLVADGVDVIVAVATPTAATMLAAVEDTDIPVVYSAVTDPAAAGFDTEPNITGTSDALNTDAIMNLILAVNPDIDTIGLLYDLSQDSSAQAIADAKAFCDSKGIKYIEKNGTTTAEVQMAAEALIAAGVKAVFTPTDNTVMTAELSIYETFTEAGVQHYTGADSFALNGAFVGYGVDYVQLGEATADMVVELLCDGKTPCRPALPDLRQRHCHHQHRDLRGSGPRPRHREEGLCTLLHRGRGSDHGGKLWLNLSVIASNATSPIEGRLWHFVKLSLFARGSLGRGAVERYETERLHIKIKGAHHAGEYLFAQRHPDRARAGLHLRPRCAGSVSELFHPEYRGPVHGRLLHPWLRCRLSGGADRPPLPRPAGGDGGRCMLRFHHSFLQTRLGVESIMAGIIVNTGLYTINLAVMGFSSTMSLVKTDTVFSIAKSALSFTGGGYKLVLAAVVIALAGAAMVGFLGTRLGLSIRATGDNAAMVRASSINPAFTITVGLCISGALTALSGGLLAQYQKSCDINVGTGMVTIALASLIIGETLVGKRTMVRRVLGVVFGSCLYRFIVAVALPLQRPGCCHEAGQRHHRGGGHLDARHPGEESPLRSAAVRPVRHGRSVCKMEMLELRDLHKTFNPGTVNEKVALNGVSLTMEAGDFATIVGSNGAGKSTLFNAITGGFIADEGQHHAGRRGHHLRAGISAQPGHRPPVPGPAQGHGPQHDHRGESGAGLPSRRDRPPTPSSPASPARIRRSSVRSWPCWIWASKTG